MHYDCVFGVFPALYLPTELAHVTTRIIYTYIRLHPTVTYSPDMHALLAPVLYIALRDPEEGARDTLIHRERSVAHRRLDRAEAAAFQLFHALASQVFRHWQQDPRTGQTFAAAVAERVQLRLCERDAEMAQHLFGHLQVKLAPSLALSSSRLQAGSPASISRAAGDLR